MAYAIGQQKKVARARATFANDYNVQLFSWRVGAMISSDSLADGTEAPSCKKSHLSLAAPFFLGDMVYISCMS